MDVNLFIIFNTLIAILLLYFTWTIDTELDDKKCTDSQSKSIFKVFYLFSTFIISYSFTHYLVSGGKPHSSSGIYTVLISITGFILMVLSGMVISSSKNYTDCEVITDNGYKLILLSLAAFLLPIFNLIVRKIFPPPPPPPVYTPPPPPPPKKPKSFTIVINDD
jgi:hypothetical protein